MNFIETFFSKYSDEKIISLFRNISKIEGITCFLLYLVAMPLKLYTKSDFSLIFMIIVGNFHGLFFILYLIYCIPARKIFKWDDEDFVFVLLSAFFPFATIWVEKKLAKFNRE